ncbi:MAG: enolase C-terminal domain-like protein [Chthoniobacterales bacterium]
MSTTIRKIHAVDRRFTLKPGAGSDAVHTNPSYSYAVTELISDGDLKGTGITLHMGLGNEIICRAIELLAEELVGREIEELMASWGETSHRISNHPQLRWLGPHKGVVGLALSSISNACFDLWAKARNVPLWKLLLDLTPEQFVALLDLSYLEDVLTKEEAIAILRNQQSTRHEREGILLRGYPGYDTSVGWFNYTDDMIRENVKKATAEGFTAMKLKVGSKEAERDLRRARIIRETAGEKAIIMVDANQQWTLPQALRIGLELIKVVNPFWIEEPTHPDDIIAHQTLARALYPTQIALGEHVSNRVLFKNFLQAGAMQVCQVDATRVAGVDEFLTVSLMARKFNVRLVPHIGDMGQIHQHLVFVNHIAMGHEALFLEYIPHLRDYFINPARVSAGVYHAPQDAGLSCDLVSEGR